MKRSAPMKRVGIGRRAPPRQERLPVVLARGTGRGVIGPGTGGLAVPKRVPVRSKAVVVACRAIPCQNCYAMDGTVCGAHGNWAQYGKGGAQKADDNRVAALCNRCHSDLDQGSRMSGEERRAMWEAAHERTVVALVGAGLWPAAVPVPPEWETVIVDGVIVELRKDTRK